MWRTELSVSSDWSCPGLGWSFQRPATEPVRQPGHFRSRSNAEGRALTRPTLLSRFDSDASLHAAGFLSVMWRISFYKVVNLKHDRSLLSVQVEEGSAKPGRDFTHSTASLIQFDPGLFLLDSTRVQDFSALFYTVCVRGLSIGAFQHWHEFVFWIWFQCLVPVKHSSCGSSDHWSWYPQSAVIMVVLCLCLLF